MGKCPTQVFDVLYKKSFLLKENSCFVFMAIQNIISMPKVSKDSNLALPSFLSTFLFDVNLNKLAQFVGAITDFLHPGLISITTFGKISIFPTLSIPTIIFTLYSETLTWPRL